MKPADSNGRCLTGGNQVGLRSLTKLIRQVQDEAFKLGYCQAAEEGEEKLRRAIAAARKSWCRNGDEPAREIDEENTRLIGLVSDIRTALGVGALTDEELVRHIRDVADFHRKEMEAWEARNNFGGPS